VINNRRIAGLRESNQRKENKLDQLDNEIDLRGQVSASRQIANLSRKAL